MEPSQPILCPVLVLLTDIQCTVQFLTATHTLRHWTCQGKRARTCFYSTHCSVFLARRYTYILADWLGQLPGLSGTACFFDIYLTV